MSYRTKLGTRDLAATLVLVTPLLFSGCKEKPKPEPAAKPAPSAKAATSPEIANAVEQMAKSAEQSRTQPAPEDAPPPNGVFAPGAADRVVQRGALAKVVVGSTGTEPKVLLAIKSFGGPQPVQGQMRLAQQTGPQVAFPTLDVKLEVSSKKVRKDEKSSHQVSAKIRATALAADQPGRIPEAAAQELAKLAGSRVSFRVEDDSARDVKAELSRAADPGLAPMLDVMGRALTAAIFPVPDERVGVGAYWMVSSREDVEGVDTLTHRLVRLETVSPSWVTLSIHLRRYAATSRVDLPGAPPNQIVEFKSEGPSEITLIPGDALPVRAKVEHVFQALVDTGQGGPGRASLQTSSRIEFGFPREP